MSVFLVNDSSKICLRVKTIANDCAVCYSFDRDLSREQSEGAERARHRAVDYSSINLSCVAIVVYTYNIYSQS